MEIKFDIATLPIKGETEAICQLVAERSILSSYRKPAPLDAPTKFWSIEVNRTAAEFTEKSKQKKKEEENWDLTTAVIRLYMLHVTEQVLKRGTTDMAH